MYKINLLNDINVKARKRQMKRVYLSMAAKAVTVILAAFVFVYFVVNSVPDWETHAECFKDGKRVYQELVIRSPGPRDIGAGPRDIGDGYWLVNGDTIEATACITIQKLKN